MKNITKALFVTSVMITSLEVESAAYCPDGFFRTRPVYMEGPTLWTTQLGSFLDGLFQEFDGSWGPYIVAGGSANYSTDSYPQFALYDLFAAYQADSTDFGGSTGLSVNSDSLKRYYWGVYGGYHCPINGNWDLGIEMGYKKLVRSQATTNIVHSVFPITAPLLTPFRNVHNKAWDLLFTLKYQTLSGFNLFMKAGGAKVTTEILEGNFISSGDPSLSGQNAFGIRYYSLNNVYPEIEVGAGYRFLNHFEMHLSYAKIIGYYENDLVSSTNIFFRPRKCPSIDLFSVSLEFLFF